MAETPERPDTGEIAAPADYGTVGHSTWDQSAAWRSAVSLDPRTAWGANGTIDLFEATLADTHVRAMLSQRLDAGVAPPLEIEPGGTARRDRLAAEDLVDQMEAIGIDRITRELLHAIWYGYAVAEAIWDIDGCRVRLADLRVRDPRIIRWDTRTQEPLLVTRANVTGLLRRLEERELITLTRCDDEIAEAEAVVHRLRMLEAANPELSWGDMAVLLVQQVVAP